MSNDAQRHLNFIRNCLKNRQAAVLVGAGFSRNAEKADESIPDSPMWSDLAYTFQRFLNSDETETHTLPADPLVLAEQVEALYGRHELDQLLLNTIRDRDYLPSALHEKLLRLPWSDIFTTNYDTLLERASETVYEHSFRFVRAKEDLVGTSDATRIVKLHGSFPSNRPFIITEEDYRTYPQRFAPFINTIQQTLIEKTLCLIGFSGTDPNFLKWTGWIRDNLGAENTPNIYLLLHDSLSEAETILMQRRHIIPVDLSWLVPNGTPYQIYEAALEYLRKDCSKEPETGWKLDYKFRDIQGVPLQIESVLPILQELHRTDPGWLVVPQIRLKILQSYVLEECREILTAYCRADSPCFDQDLDYLYEYDWLRERALLPLFSEEQKYYQMILERHDQEVSARRISILLSLLRHLHECGQFEQWNKLRSKLETMAVYMEPEQQQRLHWEDCLCAMARYQFEELLILLGKWRVPNGMPVWTLRRAGLLAECGQLEEALSTVRQAITEIRHRLSHQQDTNVRLLSLESALIELKHYLQEVVEIQNQLNEHGDGEIQNSSYEKQQDNQQQILHAKHQVSWSEQNRIMIAQMESVWAPFTTYVENPSFDFGIVECCRRFGGDAEAKKAFTFLRFREDTGIPFFLNSFTYGTEAARGAAERIARYSPEWSILTLVRADETKGIKTVITRGVLSEWRCEQTDIRIRLYIKALLGAEKNTPPEEWFYRRDFTRLAADVLPEVLSELCTKCSDRVLDEVLNLVEVLYGSRKKRCFQNIQPLVKRLLMGYPKEKGDILFRRLLNFPAADDPIPYLRFPEPLFLLPDDCVAQLKNKKYRFAETETLFEAYRKGNTALMNRVIFCAANGLLPEPQRLLLRDMLWQDGKFTVSNDWYWTVCLQLPAPEDIDLPQYANAMVIKSMNEYSGTVVRLPQDDHILRALNTVMINYPKAFTVEQISYIIQTLCDRIKGFIFQDQESIDVFGIRRDSINIVYNTLYSLWLLLTMKKDTGLSDTDWQTLRKTHEKCQQADIYHYGFACVVTQQYPAIIDVLSSSNKQHSQMGYDVLAAAITEPQLALLPEAVIEDGVAALCQQLRWRVPAQLSQALQIIRLVILHCSNLLSGEQLDSILVALDRLWQETGIQYMDDAGTASKKGAWRVHAAKLAKSIHETMSVPDPAGTLETWLHIIADPNEFAEIRNV